MNRAASLELRLVAHHVGARGYGVSFNVPDAFRNDVVHVLYEADAECVERMLREQGDAMAQALAEKHVLPYCLGRRRGKAMLNVTANSYASSLLPPDPGFFSYYCEIPIDAATYDVTYGEMLQVVKRVEVDVHSIDELFAEGRVPVPAVPDFLSLDTQGYELEILEGARESMAAGVLGVICEVEMIPMYTGQPLLGDVLKFMNAQGFLFAGFTAMFEVSPRRAPVGMRGKAFPGFGDALFLRDLKSLTAGRNPPERLYVMLRKAAFIGVCFGYVEYALEALAMAARLGERIPAALREQLRSLKYDRFLKKLSDIAADQQDLFPPIHAVPDNSRQPGDARTSWYDKYHAAAVKTATGAAAGGAPKARTRVAAKLARTLYRMLPARVAGHLRRVLSPAPGAVTVPATSTSYTPLERLLEDYGFGLAAHAVRQRRLAVEPYLRSLDRAMYEAGKHAHLSRN
jgi:FkbM family methyltransferase